MASKSVPSSLKINKKALKEAEDIVKELLELCDVEAEVTVSKGEYENAEGGEEEYVSVNIEGEEIGVLIGYLGRNLKSLQRVVGLILNRRLNADEEKREFARVVIDVSGYRGKREESLKRMAEQVREEVVSSGEAADLPSMTSYERRVIHTYLNEFDDVTTESFGEGAGRHVKVLPTGGADSDVEQDKDEEKDGDSEE